jgi:hypothetical protein
MALEQSDIGFGRAMAVRLFWLNMSTQRGGFFRDSIPICDFFFNLTLSEVPSALAVDIAS